MKLSRSLMALLVAVLGMMVGIGSIADMRLPSAARRARDLPEPSALSDHKGAGNAGCPMHPQPGVRMVS